MKRSSTTEGINAKIAQAVLGCMTTMEEERSDWEASYRTETLSGFGVLHVTMWPSAPGAYVANVVAVSKLFEAVREVRFFSQMPQSVAEEPADDDESCLLIVGEWSEDFFVHLRIFMAPPPWSPE